MSATVAATGNGLVFALIDAKGRLNRLNGHELGGVDLCADRQRLGGRGWRHAMDYVRGTNVLRVRSHHSSGAEIERRYAAIDEELHVASHTKLSWSDQVAGLAAPLVVGSDARWPLEFDRPPLGGATRSIIVDVVTELADREGVAETYARSVLVIALHHQRSGEFAAPPGQDILLAHALDVCGERGAADAFFAWALKARTINEHLMWGLAQHLRFAHGSAVRERYEGLREGPGPELAETPPPAPSSGVAATLWRAWQHAIAGRRARAASALQSAIRSRSSLDLFFNKEGIDLSAHALFLLTVHALVPPRPSAADYFFGDMSEVQQIRRLRALYGGAFHGGLPTAGDSPALEVELRKGLEATGVLAGDAPMTRRPDGLWTAPLPAAAPGEVVRYKIKVLQADAEQTEIWASDNDPRPGGQEFAFQSEPLPPDWVHDAVLYQVMVDRFARPGGELPKPGSSTALYGGTLDGVTEHLDHIASLGCNVIWLTPIQRSPSHHGYDYEDFFQVEERYGGEPALKRFIAAAHDRDMRVLLDFVPNHTGRGHFLFRDAVAEGGEAAEFFRFWQWPHYYRSFFDVITLPELDTGNPRVQDYLVRVAQHWVTDYDADGVRCDHVAGVDPAFWIALRRGLRAVKPDALILGEATAGFEWLARYSGRLDAIFDFDFCYVVRQVLATGQMDAAAFAQWLDEHEHRYPGLALVTLLDNHDMNRFLWMAGGDVDRLKLASTLLMTLPGTPAIYYGTEVGLGQRHDGRGENAEARLPMLWGADQNADLLEHFQRLGRIRHESAALRRGTRRTLLADKEVLAYERALDNECVVVALNFSMRPQKRDLPGCGTVELGPLGSQVIDKATITAS